MRLGQLRGVTLAGALLAVCSMIQDAAADGFVKTIPREVLAQDLNTGQPYFAPAIPWGCYAKDGPFDHFYPKAGHFGFLHNQCKNCGGSGLGHGGKGCGGCGGSGCSLGSKCGNGGGCGLFGHGGGNGLGSGGCGLFGHGCGAKGDGCGNGGCGSGHGSTRRIKDCGLCGNKGCGLCQSSTIGAPIYVTASSQSPSPQVVGPVSSPQFVDPSSGFVGGQTSLCDGCVGKGCGKCGFGGLLHKGPGDPCGGCGTKGCGGKCGLFGHGDACGGCGTKGCGGKCGLFGHGGGQGGGDGNGCRNCGGRGCGLCHGGGHLKSKLAGLLHHKQGQIKYFVGPGGPVPLTPGYVPYTITTRSPRDFLAFPPYTPSEF